MRGDQGQRKETRKVEKKLQTHSSGLVGAEDGNTSELLDGSDTGNDSLVLGELLSSDSESDGENGRHGDGDTTDQEYEDVVETATVRVVESGVKNDDFEDDEDSDGDQAEETDLSENSLKTSRRIVNFFLSSRTAKRNDCSPGDDR